MATLGRRNLLPVSRAADAGAYLDAGPLGEVLLPRRYVTPAMRPGTQVDAFLYRDSEDRLVATTERPLAMVGEFACMEVRDISERAGAFLGWGLPKDLLLPFREQGKPVKLGQRVVVAVVMDGRTDRIIASAKVDDHLRRGIPLYRAGQEVDALVFARTPLGFGVVVENAWRGLLFHDGAPREVRYGERLRAFVRAVRDDGKVDLGFEPAGYARVAPLGERIMEALAAAGGTLPVGDHTPPQEVRTRFGASKKAFKQALGALYRERRIEIGEGGIRAVGEAAP
jgi:predicted RNA-binding protein (virulence factor B family)